MPHALTVVISVAGMGTRLGLNLPKALVEVDGKPILVRQLQVLDDVEDIVVVAGFRSELVIELLRRERPDARVALNHDYSSTGTAASVSIGSRFSNEWVLSLDGDLLVRRQDLRAILDCPTACVGLTPVRSKMPVWAELAEDNSVIGLSQNHETEWEWSGLAKIPAELARNLGRGHVFTGLQKRLPLASMIVDCVEIDDLDDLAYAATWVRGGSTNG